MLQMIIRQLLQLAQLHGPTTTYSVVLMTDTLLPRYRWLLALLRNAIRFCVSIRKQPMRQHDLLHVDSDEALFEPHLEISIC